MPIRSTVLAEELVSIIADPERGPISLVGANGGLTLVTGEIYPSNVMPGTLAIETEHGTIRLEPGTHVQISEDVSGPLDAGDLEAIGEALRILLEERFLWTADPEDTTANEALHALTRDVGDLVSGFLNPAPTSAAPIEAEGDHTADRFDRIANELSVHDPDRIEEP